MSNQDNRLDQYVSQISDALMGDEGRVYVTEAYTACMIMAIRLLSMLKPEARAALCTIVEEKFRADVEETAAEPDSQAGIVSMH